jgi:hypothetical protein
MLTTPEQPPTMTYFLECTAPLTCHPETYSQDVHGIEARVNWTEGEVLAVTYTLYGDIKRLLIPPSGAPCRADYLWQHTCFEAFVSVKAKPEYCEFNFSPSREWAAYHFHRYRDGAPLDDRALAPKITARRTDTRLDLDATIHLHRLPLMRQKCCLRLGLCAVIEGENGALSYWALKHPPGRPDFHHPDGFVLKIERSDMKMVSQARMEKR